MSHKYYEVKIVESLLGKKNHIRGLAKELRTNQTTVARKLRQLYKQNVVDFAFEGKNKVYSLKKSLESLQFILIAESFKFIEVLEKYPYLRQIFQYIKNDSHITLAILFGSHASLSAGKNSDIDIFILAKDRKIKQGIESIDSRASVKIGNFNFNAPLIREIIKKHVIIKGLDVYYEKVKFLK